MVMAAKEIPVDGHCDDRFALVERAFRENFECRGDIGAAIAIYCEGQLVVDLWGGYVDQDRTRAWQRDTLVNVWSTTKGIIAICFALAVDRGLCSYKDRVAFHWPEFGVAGKEDVTIGQLLSHQAGLSAWDDQTEWQEFGQRSELAARLAQQAPRWEVGSMAGYHAITIGFMASELLHRITGYAVREFVAKEMEGLGVYIGLPERLADQAADVLAPSGSTAEDVVAELSPLQIATLNHPPLLPEYANTSLWRNADIPSANGFATARGLAAAYSSFAFSAPDQRLSVSPSTLREATKVRWEGTDAVLAFPARWAAGFLRNCNGLYGPSQQSYGHSGWGGSFAFADPTKRLACAYTMNRMGMQLVDDPRNMALIEAVYAAGGAAWC